MLHLGTSEVISIPVLVPHQPDYLDGEVTDTERQQDGDVRFHGSPLPFHSQRILRGREQNNIQGVAQYTLFL